MDGTKKRQTTDDSSLTRKKHKSDSLKENTSSEEPAPSTKVMDSLPNGNMVASRDMCTFCFDVVVAHFFKKIEKPQPNFTNDSYPLFVTWKIGEEKRLRGCIGTFSSLSLHRGIKEYAITSAMNDSRFSPVSKNEISQLSVSVSLLVDFEDGTDYLDWTVGVHGIKIEFCYGRSTKTATFLPDVAHEQGWNKEDTVEALLKKAGVRGPLTQSLKDSIKLIRYRSEKVEMTFEEYAREKQYVPELLNGSYTPISNGHGSRLTNGFRH